MPQEELEVGPYDVNGVKLDIDIGTFPDYKRIIPHYTDNEAITLDLKNAVVEKNKRAKGKFYYALSDNVGIDKAYLDHALSRDIGFTMYWDYSGHPALFKFDDGSQAVIMPVRV